MSHGSDDISSNDTDSRSNDTDSKSNDTYDDDDTDSSVERNNQLQRRKRQNPHHDSSSNNTNDDTDNAEEYETGDEESYESGSTMTTATDDTDEDEDSIDDNVIPNHGESVPNSQSAKLIPLTDENDSNEQQESGDTISSEEEEEEDDDDDEDEEEEEAEPQLKYQRLGGGVSGMMVHDSASSLQCHPRFLVLGMVSGTVYVLDPHGDIIKEYQAHASVAVNDISIDENGDHVATCSRDGRVVIRDIFKDVQTVHNFRNQDLLSIELHPSYGTQQMFVTGGRGQQLLLRSIGFFRSDNKVLHSGEGAIYCIAWKCELIAWANDRGVKIFDICDHKPIAHINRSNRGSPDPERYSCCLCWENRQTLLIGWGDWVKIGRIRTVRTQTGHVMKEVHVTNVFITDFYICGIAPFKQDLILLAFSEHDDDDDDDDSIENEEEMAGIGNSKPPELRIVSRRGEWIATDALPIHKYRANEAKDYKLVWSHDELSPVHVSSGNTYDNTFYIVSPSDIVASLPRTVEDHIKWLWERQEYERAWRQAAKYSDELIRSKLNATSLGEEYLKYVLEEGKNVERFGSLLSDVCLSNVALWEKWILILSEKAQLDLIIDVVPMTLSPSSYELVLRFLIEKDLHCALLECVTKWDPSLYDISTILCDATNRLNEIRQSDALIQALAQLFYLDGSFEKALEYYLQLKSHLCRNWNIVDLLRQRQDLAYLRNETIDAMIAEYEEEKYNEGQKSSTTHRDPRLSTISDAVFGMIIKHSLWPAAEDRMISLIELDVFRSSKLLIEYASSHNRVIERVTLQISSHQSNAQYAQYFKFFMYLYLHELVGCADGSEYREFHDYLVALYAEFNTRQLSNFLAVSHHVKFSKALSVCEKRLSATASAVVRRNLNECYVFILNRMGNFTEALQVILIRLEDVEKAVKFVEKQSDKSLWNHLIERTLRDAKSLMPKLLDAVKGHPNVDAQELIQKIPNNLHIVGLRRKIIAIFEEYSKEKLLTKGTTDILKSDCLKLQHKLYREASKGIKIDSHQQKCIVCQLPLCQQTIKLFYCRHAYHADCYREKQQHIHANTDDVDKCLICFSASQSARRDRGIASAAAASSTNNNNNRLNSYKRIRHR